MSLAQVVFQRKAGLHVSCVLCLYGKVRNPGGKRQGGNSGSVTEEPAPSGRPEQRGCGHAICFQSRSRRTPPARPKEDTYGLAKRGFLKRGTLNHTKFRTSRRRSLTLQRLYSYLIFFLFPKCWSVCSFLKCQLNVINAVFVKFSSCDSWHSSLCLCSLSVAVRNS